MSPVLQPRTGEPVSREQLLESVADPQISALIAQLRRPESYDFERLFPRTSGRGSLADVRKRVIMLTSIEPRFDHLLYPDERIGFVAKGVLNSFVEQYLMGIWAIFINRTLILLTNYRAILVQCDSSGRARLMAWQIPYQRVKRYGGHANPVKFRLDDNTALSYTGIPSKDRKLIGAFVRAQLDRLDRDGAQFPSHKPRDPLCPRCGTPVPPNTYACPECAERFTHPMKPTLMSLLVPGLGNLAMGQTGLAIVEMCGFAFFVALAIVLALAVNPLLGLLVIAVTNTFDAAMTHHVARKGVRPARFAWRSV